MARTGPKNEHLNNMHAKLKLALKTLGPEIENSSITNYTSQEEYQRFYLELLENKRKLLNQMNLEAEFDEELIRKYLSLIDMEEFRIREKQLPES